MMRFGHNLGYIDELYQRFRSDPGSVSEAWQEFFRDYRPDSATPTAVPPAATHPAPAAPATPPEAESAAAGVPLRGISGKIAENMTDSLRVPTATSARTIPVKLLEENRKILNQHQEIVAGAKISFTHLIAWAIVRSLGEHPRMNATFHERGGTPHLVPREQINFGLAIDIQRRGERVLLVPNIKNATALSFPEFVQAYDALVARARDNKLSVDDFQGTTVTLTNPGMLGTALSVPRLMQGQGTIIGIGAIGFPAEYSGMAPEMISELGLSRVMTVTSTYDHRVIQGAESGQFLATLEKLLQGHEGFYVRLFKELGVPREPIEWSGDRHPLLLHSGHSEAIAKQAGVLQLIRAYRVRGHLWADLDPLGYHPQPTPELELSTYGLSAWDLDRSFVARGLGGNPDPMKLREILDLLQRTYCRHIGVEFMHIPDPDPRNWLHDRLEHPDSSAPLTRAEQIHILKKLNAAEAFEAFLHSSYVGQKRFSLEGAETLLPMLDTLLSEAAAAGMVDAVIGMAHRGRLNVLAHIVGKSYGQIFGEFEGIDPESAHGSGDVKYHLGASGVFVAPDESRLQISVASNPSHLEAVNPVVEGMVRARQDRLRDEQHERVLPILIHGDAAFSGQGVVAETLNLSLLRGYRTGGTIHVVINNQIGFTTRPDDLRSSLYSTDVAKMLRSPIFHVNGDHPEEAVRVMRHAMAFRQRFKRDVVVDLVCYRRWGHNEGDDPSYTSPILYAQIEKHRSVRKLYTEQLVRRGDFDMNTAEQALEDYRKRFREVHDQVRKAQEGAPAPLAEDREAIEGSARPRKLRPAPETLLREVLEGLDRVPEGFRKHPKLARLLDQRRQRFDDDRIDWGLAEALAFGSLVVEGTRVRLSGEDSGRGTFSQRHAVLHDHATGTPYVPLAHLRESQAPFQVYDSLLSEFAVLGFDYGYSVEYPEALVMWEAQFGDFCNGAQVIIDQFIVSAEDKWNQLSSLVMLLPHGYEGQGPEHSSARLERFLQLSARGNIQVCYPSTPAQYFHLLRAQVAQDHRTPLVVMTPKSLLRHPACVSSRQELTGGEFHVVLDDAGNLDDAAVKRLVLCTGKVYYDLVERRDSGEHPVAVVRVEQLYPFPSARLSEVCRRYPSARDVVWAQEEPRNMGAWSFVHERLPEYLQPGQRLRYVGRHRGPSPATGSHERHVREQQALVAAAIEQAPPEAAPLTASGTGDAGAAGN